MRVEAFDDYIIRMDTVAAVYDRRLEIGHLCAAWRTPLLEIDPERPFSANFVTVSSLFQTQNFRKRAFPDRPLGEGVPLLEQQGWLRY